MLNDLFKRGAEPIRSNWWERVRDVDPLFGTELGEEGEVSLERLMWK